MSYVIKTENLGKSYIIGHQRQEGYQTFRDVLMHAARNVWQYARHPLSFNREQVCIEEFWALRNICVEIQQGDRVGIIGRNGAGKSTLLKIISRITEPTEGKVRIRGRVASLLEVGTGFHRELTGRENIFLNGAVLGMTRQEIKKKFDEIVAFSEVENFLDTPVKRYSSGMYVRLAFAVAAHLEPEILIVDEVLAVGDAAFQKKCIGKMKDFGKEGQTVIFVSHNMQAVKQLCSKGLVINAGKLIFNGDSSQAIEQYVHKKDQDTHLTNIKNVINSIPDDPVFAFLRINIIQNNEPVEVVLNGIPLDIVFEYQVFKKTIGLRVYFDLCDTEDTILFRSFHDEDNAGIPTVEPGRYISTASIPANLLAPNSYELKIRGTIHNIRTFPPKEGVCLKFSVERSGIANRAYLGEPIRGKLAPIIPWQTTRIG